MPANDYKMRDRFFSVACVLDVASAQKDATLFDHINRTRNDFYHRMEVRDKDLPTNDVRILFRKYLRLGLSYESRAQHGMEPC